MVAIQLASYVILNFLLDDSQTTIIIGGAVAIVSALVICFIITIVLVLLVRRRKRKQFQIRIEKFINVEEPKEERFAYIAVYNLQILSTWCYLCRYMLTPLHKNSSDNNTGSYLTVLLNVICNFICTNCTFTYTQCWKWTLILWLASYMQS